MIATWSLPAYPMIVHHNKSSTILAVQCCIFISRRATDSDHHIYIDSINSHEDTAPASGRACQAERCCIAYNCRQCGWRQRGARPTPTRHMRVPSCACYFAVIGRRTIISMMHRTLARLGAGAVATLYYI